jgi:predicted GIY-YIG superfamily endonuclease
LFVVYILRCVDGTLYIGHTNEVQERLSRHNRGEGCPYTARRVPVTLVFSEPHPTRQAAAARERQLKRWTRRKETLVAGDLDLLKRL